MKTLLMYSILAALIMNPQLAVSPNANHSVEFAPLAEAADNYSACDFRLQETKPAMAVWITAYSSTPEETDDTPFTTASSKLVRDGIVATNFLPFGTRLAIPAIFGDKVFTVEDRMHKRKKNFLDVWMPTKQDAVQFGIQCARIIIDQNETLIRPDIAGLLNRKQNLAHSMSSAPLVATL